MEIKIVEFGSELYRQMLAVRNKVLREPLNLHLSEEDTATDFRNIHIALLNGNEVIGTTLLLPLNNEIIKIRQVAVLEEFQRRGFGKKLMLFAEATAKKMGFKKAILHARYTVIEFYRKLGYRIISDEFTEVGLPHYKMEKFL